MEVVYTRCRGARRMRGTASRSLTDAAALAALGKGKLREKRPALERALVEDAQAAGRSRTTDLGAQYRRRAARRGKKKATGTVEQLDQVASASVFHSGS